MMPSFDFTGLTLSLQPGVPPSAAMVPIIAIDPSSVLVAAAAVASVVAIAVVARWRRRKVVRRTSASGLRRAA